VVGWPSSIRVRLALWHSILLGLPLILFATVSYIAFSRALIDGTDRFMSEALVAFTRELGAERRAGLSASLAMRTTVREVRFRALRIMILDSLGQVVAAGGPAESGEPGERVNAADDLPDESLMRTLRADHALRGSEPVTFDAPSGAYRVHTQALELEGNRYLLTGRYPMRDAERTMQQVRRIFSIAIPLLVLAAAASGYLLALRSLAPVAAMAQHATEISASNLHERLPVGGGDELVRLARVVNDLLDRLQASFEQQRRFMADASHELRTPTAIVRTEADVTLSKDHRTESEYRDSIGIMQDASRRLTRIVDDLFLLARADAGHLVVHRAPLYLEDVVDETTRSVRPLALRRQVRVELLDVVEAPVEGDSDLLGRLVLNLLDNAIKHSPEDSAVTVRMARHDDKVSVSVSDTGAGIPAEARDKIFERFFRVDAARTRPETSYTSGAGLGLAIARRIAEAHDGTLELMDSRAGHTEFRLTIPIDLPLTSPRPILATS
jgi:heavy metal sensor kinase